MSFFSKIISIRLKKEQVLALDELLDSMPEKYDSWSHIIRCAIINLLEYERGWKENGNRRIKSI
jgi:Arc/MetJ-type ribon-helix-helix transcriptional regulator